MREINKKITAIFGLLFISFILMGAKIGENDLRLGTPTGADIEFKMGSGVLKWNDADQKLKFSNDSGVSEKEIGSGGGGAGVNLLENADFESGTAAWDNVGATFTTVTSGSNLLFGDQSATWDASAGGQTLSQTLAIPNGLLSQNCSATIQYKGGDANIDFRVTDGTNVIITTTLQAATKKRKEVLTFSCPDSGNIVWEIISTADAALIALDNLKGGDATNINEINQATLFGTATWPTTASCVWTGTGGSFADFPVDSDCPDPDVTDNALVPDTKIPAIKFATVPPGKYQVILNGSMGGPVSTSCAFAISDGTSIISGVTRMQTSGAPDSNQLSSVIGTVEYTEVQTNLVFSLQLAKLSGTSCSLENDNQEEQTKIMVTRFPTSAQTVLNGNTGPFEVDVSLFTDGGLINLGVTDVVDYTRIGHPNLNIEINRGSEFAPQITCTNGTPSEGLTCNAAAVDEHLGVSVVLPRTGVLEVCYEFSLFMRLDPSAFNQSFQIVRTADNTSSITDFEETGKSKVHIDAGDTVNNENHTWYIRTCGRFQIPNAGRHAFRLYREMDFQSGIIESNQLKPDRQASAGQRDIHITMNYVNQTQNPLQLINTVQSIDGTIKRFLSADIANSGVPAVITQDGLWIDSITDTAQGDMIINLTAGTFSVKPKCDINMTGSSTDFGNSILPLSTAVRVTTKTASTGANIDSPYTIKCYGDK